MPISSLAIVYHIADCRTGCQWAVDWEWNGTGPSYQSTWSWRWFVQRWTLPYMTGSGFFSCWIILASGKTSLIICHNLHNLHLLLKIIIADPSLAVARPGGFPWSSSSSYDGAMNYRSIPTCFLSVTRDVHSIDGAEGVPECKCTLGGGHACHDSCDQRETRRTLLSHTASLKGSD